LLGDELSPLFSAPDAVGGQPGGAGVEAASKRAKFMSSNGQPPMTEPATRRARKSKARRKRRPRKQSATNVQTDDEPELAAAGSLTRTKALLLAALRVWELKHRIND
jgi:hypothetical protein